MEKKMVHVVLEVIKDFDSNGNEIEKTRAINWFMSFKAALDCCKALEKRFGFSNTDMGIYLSYKIHSVRKQGIRMENYVPFKPIN